MEFQEIIKKLRTLENKKNIEGMARFGINPKNTLGISVTTLRTIAKEIKKGTVEKAKLHKTALQLWRSEIHEARILAGLIDIPELVTEQQADSWVADLDSWDVCDTLCMNLLEKTPFAFEKAEKWAESEPEFTRRAGFAMMAVLSVHNKSAADYKFEKFFPLINKYSIDERNFVRKAVNWALRQIGKRNSMLLTKAIRLAEEIENIDSKSARWVARDALRELRGQSTKT